MRFAKQLAPVVVAIVALSLAGCANQNTSVSSLQAENARLLAEQQQMTVELAAARANVQRANDRAQEWSTECTNLRNMMKEYLLQTIQTQITQNKVSQAMTEAEKQIQNQTPATPANPQPTKTETKTTPTRVGARPPK